MERIRRGKVLKNRFQKNPEKISCLNAVSRSRAARQRTGLQPQNEYLLCLANQNNDNRQLHNNLKKCKVLLEHFQKRPKALS